MSITCIVRLAIIVRRRGKVPRARLRYNRAGQSCPCAPVPLCPCAPAPLCPAPLAPTPNLVGGTQAIGRVSRWPQGP